MTIAAPEAPAWRRRRPPAIARRDLPAVLLLIVVVVAGLAAPLLIGVLGLPGPNVREPAALNLFGQPTGPSGGHPLGVDTSGRDVLSRMLYGLRSLVLLSLAGTALALLLATVIGTLTARRRWLDLGWTAITGTLGACPALLLGLAVGLSLGPGVWRLIVTVVVTQLVVLARGPRSTRLVIAVFANAVALDVGLTFLGDGAGANTPQLGTMIAHAGRVMLAGVPAWWALLFPGLLVTLTLVTARSLADGAELELGLRPVARVGEAGDIAGEIAAAAVRLLLVVGLATLALRGFGGDAGGRHAALAGVGARLGASGSLLAGGVVVWMLATVVQLRLGTRMPRRRRLVVRQPATGSSWGVAAPLWRLGRLAVALWAAAPVGWLGFLALALFSDSIGTLALLPGAGAYTAPGHDIGHWAGALLMPWLLLGLGAATQTAPHVRARITREARGAQQRVAQAAGVPPRIRGRQARRALTGPLLELARPALPAFIGLAVLIEVTFAIPGAGALVVEDFSRRGDATVDDLAALAAALVVIVDLLVQLLSGALDPRLRWR